MPFGLPPNIDKLRKKGNVARLAQALEYTADSNPTMELAGMGPIDIRRRAAEALGELADDRAAGPLLKSALTDQWTGLSGGGYPVRAAAAHALAAIGPSAVEPLMHTLQTGDMTLRVAAADALGVIRWKPALELITALRDEVRAAHSAAAEHERSAGPDVWGEARDSLRRAEIDLQFLARDADRALTNMKRDDQGMTAVERYEERRRSIGQPKICPSCGAEFPATFDSFTCTECGSSLTRKRLP